MANRKRELRKRATQRSIIIKSVKMSGKKPPRQSHCAVDSISTDSIEKSRC